MAAPAVQGQSQSFLSSRISVQVCEKVLITERAAGTARHSHFVLPKALEPLQAWRSQSRRPCASPADGCNHEDGLKDATSTRPGDTKTQSTLTESSKKTGRVVPSQTLKYHFAEAHGI